MSVVMIGGCMDGMRTDIAPQIRNFRIPKPTGGNWDYEEYIVERLSGPTEQFTLARCITVSPDEMIRRLLDGYNPQRV